MWRNQLTDEVFSVGSNVLPCVCLMRNLVIKYIHPLTRRLGPHSAPTKAVGARPPSECLTSDHSGAHSMAAVRSSTGEKAQGEGTVALSASASSVNNIPRGRCFCSSSWRSFAFLSFHNIYSSHLLLRILEAHISL